MDVIGTKVLESFPPCCSQSPLLTDGDLKLVRNVNILNGNLKFENSQEDAQKHQRNCTFMNSASEAEFLDVIGKKVLRVFLLAIHSHLYKRIEKSGLKLVCNLKSENSQELCPETSTKLYIIEFDFWMSNTEQKIFLLQNDTSLNW